MIFHADKFKLRNVCPYIIKEPVNYIEITPVADKKILREKSDENCSKVFLKSNFFILEGCSVHLSIHELAPKFAYLVSASQYSRIWRISGT